MSVHGEHAAAARRRERRMRSFWRHEQMAVLATVQHHSHGVPRNQKTATRTGEGGNEMHYTAEFWETPLPLPSRSSSSCTRKSPAGCGQGQQERVLQHTVEHMAGVCPFVHILDAPVLQMGDRLVEVLKRLDIAVVEQVIAVPKLSIDSIPLRSVLCEPQMAEQLVEVPTDVVLVEQIVNIPVPAAHGVPGYGGLSSQSEVLFLLTSRPSTW